MTKNNKDKILEFKKPITIDNEALSLDLANKIQVINELANEGIISPKERLRIIKRLVD